MMLLSTHVRKEELKKWPFNQIMLTLRRRSGTDCNAVSPAKAETPAWCGCFAFPMRYAKDPLSPVCGRATNGAGS